MSLKERIIMVALDLFGEKGYTKTTIADICHAANTSKGGFYHHFESKEQVLENITEMYFGEVKARYYEMLHSSESDTFALLSAVFVTVNNYKKEQFTKWDSLVKLYGHRDSHYIITKLAFSFEELTAAIYEQLLGRGISGGLFTLANPKALAQLWSHEMVVLYGLINKVVVNPEEQSIRQEYLERAKFLEEIINNALGLAIPRINILQPAQEYLDIVLKGIVDYSNKK